MIIFREEKSIFYVIRLGCFFVFESFLYVVKIFINQMINKNKVSIIISLLIIRHTRKEHMYILKKKQIRHIILLTDLICFFFFSPSRETKSSDKI